VITLCGSLSTLPSPLGRAMHEAGYRALGLSFTYVPFAVRDLEGAIRGMRGLGIRGFGVSYPFKQAVMPLLDDIDPVAARIGAVNTIVNTGGRLVGHNTDWTGAVRALEEVIALHGARVLLLGAGGAARAIAYGLAERGARVLVANRDTSKAEALARETGAAFAGLGAAEHARDHDAVVNATTRGMTGEDLTSPVPASALRPGLVVMDIVYKPVETALVASARAASAIAVDGSRMLLHQAARQFELYTERDAPLEAMDAAIRAAVH
jgi:shikimate dehydrogenase